MGKITQVNNGDTGLEARNKINEAMKSVETDATLSGDGTTSSPLSVVSSGGGNKTITQTAINITVNGTTDIPISDDVKTLLFTDGVTSQNFTFSNLSNTEEFTATRIIDNSANNSAVTLTWPGGQYWDDSVPVTGLAGIAALSKYELNVFVRSSSIARIEIIPFAK